MRKVLKDLKPSEFEDIISVWPCTVQVRWSLFRNILQVNMDRWRSFIHTQRLEPILRDTYGIIVYQEQIMQIASSMAGFSLGEADLLRTSCFQEEAGSAG